MASSRSYNDIVISIGKLFDQTFTWSISDVPVNLTGYTATMKMKRVGDASNLLDTLSSTLSAGSGIILGGAAGTVQIKIKTAKTQTYAPGEYTFELALTRPDGEDIEFMSGQLTVIRGDTD